MTMIKRIRETNPRDCRKYHKTITELKKYMTAQLRKEVAFVNRDYKQRTYIWR